MAAILSRPQCVNNYYHIFQGPMSLEHSGMEFEFFNATE